MAKAGAAFGAHSATHPRLPPVGAERLDAEICQSRADLERELCTPPILFAYPHGDSDPRVRAAVAEAGFVAACGTLEGRNHPGTDVMQLRRTNVFGRDSFAGFLRALSSGRTHGQRRVGAAIMQWKANPRLRLSQLFSKVRRAPSKPRILLLADRRNWAFDIEARAMGRALSEEFACDIQYAEEEPRLDPARYDLIVVYFWGETWYRQFNFECERIVKMIRSHRWEDDPDWGPCTPAEFAGRYLRDAGAVFCSSERLHQLLNGVHPYQHHTPIGLESSWFKPPKPRHGPLVIGWAGNPRDGVKGIHDVIAPAAQGFDLRVADSLPPNKMPAFYAGIDVITVASRHEGTPRPLLEGMASGCFPVSVDVGIVPELVQDGKNGLIVRERTAEAFREAFAWCADHLPEVRQQGAANARQAARERRIEETSRSFRQGLRETLSRAQKLRFRNDDVGYDTDLVRFREFCAIFRRHGLRQLHGITLYGRLAVVHGTADQPTPYEGEPSTADMPNERIRALAKHEPFLARTDVIEFLRDSPDEIGLHGLYHVDFSQMSAEEQKREIVEGLRLLSRLFPGKLVRHFIAPFNRTNAATREVCHDIGIQLLAEDGVHLEEELATVSAFKPGTWYRYHHHRFYPETRFRYWDLSFARLDAALTRAEQSGLI